MTIHKLREPQQCIVLANQERVTNNDYTPFSSVQSSEQHNQHRPHRRCVGDNNAVQPGYYQPVVTNNDQLKVILCAEPTTIIVPHITDLSLPVPNHSFARSAEANQRPHYSRQSARSFPCVHTRHRQLPFSADGSF